MRLPTVLLCLLLAGCAKPDEATPGPSCGQRFAGPPGDNVSLVASLRDDPEVVAERIASVAGDRVAGPPEALADGEVRFPTINGSASHRRTGGEASFDARAWWSGRAAWGDATPREVAARLVEAFHAPPEWFAFDGGSFTQTYLGEPIRGAGGSATSDALSVGPVYEIRPRTEPMDAARALPIARAYAACAWTTQEGALDAENAGLGVRDGSLTRVVLVRDPGRAGEGPCGVALEVHVDAATGAVRGEAPPVCD